MLLINSILKVDLTHLNPYILNNEFIPISHMNKKFYKTVFISDVHLWNPKNQWDKLIKFLDSISFENLIIVWDFIDYRQLNWFWKRWEKEQKTLNYINDLATHWVKVTYIQWNHDRELKCWDWIEIENMTITRHIYYQTVKKKTYFITHWDCLDSVNNKHNRIWEFWSKVYSLWLHIEHIWNKKVYDISCFSIPEKIDKRVKWRRVPEYKINSKILDFSKNLNCDWIIIWHFHIAKHYNLNGLDYFNTWDRMRNCSAVVEDKKWELSLLFYQ